MSLSGDQLIHNVPQVERETRDHVVHHVEVYTRHNLGTVTLTKWCMDVMMSRSLDAWWLPRVLTPTPHDRIPCWVWGNMGREVKCQFWVFHAWYEISIVNTQEYGKIGEANGNMLTVNLEVDPSWPMEIGLSAVYLEYARYFQDQLMIRRVQSRKYGANDRIPLIIDLDSQT